MATESIPISEFETRSDFITLDELEIICADSPSSYVVDGLLPADDVHVAVGDSGLGKTPWAYQLGLCVASGTPFLGHAVRQGKVLYYDLENGREEILRVGHAVCGYLELPAFPNDFLVLRDEANPSRLKDAIACHRPLLVIIDTLRAFRPKAESANDEMAIFLGQCKQLARRYHCAILLLHHLRKPGENGMARLETTPVLQWLLHASGARALINQSNTRIAFEERSTEVLVVKSFAKMRGESGPYFLERVFDEDGEPIGYRRMAGCNLLGNKEQQAALDKLPNPPEPFTFKDARYAYGKTDNPTRQWLKKCEAVGMVKQTERGQYVKVEAPEVSWPVREIGRA